MAVVGGQRTPGGQEPRAVRKALALLEAVAQLGPGTTARAVADHAGVAPATAYRLLNLLVGDGYLVRIDGLAGFALGRRARELAAEVDRPAPVRAVVEDLRRAIRHGVHVVGLVGRQPEWIDRDPDHEEVADDAMLAAWHSSATGKLMLSAHPELLTGRPLPRHTPHTVTQWPVLMEQLHQTRCSGWAVDRQETVLGRVALARAIQDGAERLTGCILLTGRVGRLDPDSAEVREPLAVASRRLTGWRGTSRIRASPG